MKAVINLFLEEVKEIVQILKIKYKPEKIILFGSLANGKTDEDSDIDLIIIKQTKKNPWERAAEVDQFIKHNVPVDFLVYTPEEVKERVQINDFFIKEVLEKGQVIYEG
ncbi:nucleotidyltransferase domain-containing protein [bacterium]|nr:nucleotidyltransferase domain-containing protein [bacterium]MBU1152419.1 nucleotidyltransferase domain-containing protein [bacterium]MBU2600488.1 nucleotidyltransferase domain-containing protein [bacterium]